jgi:hypothetical protein
MLEIECRPPLRRYSNRKRRLECGHLRVGPIDSQSNRDVPVVASEEAVRYRNKQVNRTDKLQHLHSVTRRNAMGRATGGKKSMSDMRNERYQR